VETVFYIDEEREVRSADDVAALGHVTRANVTRLILSRDTATPAELWAAMVEISALPKRRPSGRHRHRPLPSTSIIRVRCSRNPKKGRSAARWRLYRDGMTLGEYIASGGRRSDVTWDMEKGFVEVEAPPQLPQHDSAATDAD